jgi:hypothetical protein
MTEKPPLGGFLSSDNFLFPRRLFFRSVANKRIQGLNALESWFSSQPTNNKSSASQNAALILGRSPESTRGSDLRTKVDAVDQTER